MRNHSHKTPFEPSDVTRPLRRYGGYYVGDTSRKVVYLTFDAGDENGNTPKILDSLKRNKVTAAFFLTGNYVRDYPTLIRRMLAGGNLVCNHTWSHPSMPSVADDRAAFARQIEKPARLFAKLMGRPMARFLRPPMGDWSPRSLCLTRALGYKTVFWSFAQVDYDLKAQPPVAKTVARILDGSHNGAIYLLHAVSSSDAQALDTAIKGLKAMGYRFGSLLELP